MSYDVVVVGGGPVGLVLACELRLGGTSVVVLERLTEIDPTIKAGALNTPSVEALYRRGLLPALKEAHDRTLELVATFMRGRAPGEGPRRTPPRFAGHFAGMMLSADRLDADDPDLSGHGPAAEIGLVSQQQLEQILAVRAAELGVEVRRGVEVTGFTDDGERVTVTTTGGPVHGRWLVGCDGGRSTVRKLAGFEFPGTDPEITAYQAVAEMEGTEHLGVGWQATPTGVYSHGPVPGRVLVARFDGVARSGADRTAPVTTEELQDAVRHVTGADVVVKEIRTATRFTDNARQAATYRLGRVLLAGDAAHVHSPFGGQGLNLGLGDAVNLGWKLAAVVRGQAQEGLLDTYTEERHPIGAWVLDWTRAQIALMRPDAHARAARAVVADLIETVAGTTYFVKKISGVWQRYDMPGDSGHPLVGRSAPDYEFEDGSRLADHLHDGRGLLVRQSGSGLGGTAVDGCGDRVTIVTTAIRDPHAPGALLVRPDGFVAWAEDPDGTDAEGLANALETWFGVPADVPVALR
ncbi:FAD-dependent monooxygenase [Microbispora sp. NEAU-D428]|uniref:FAD-dependent oxidoreductase n=1 Tax=Microbispora sitophila TaxID=2771537 RepID=UPI001866A9E8|nr:FAD-dependent oxidoreductase [Microbispora sitophila]MBE3010527.1 FAD-dependent monooxygenase [Microbispora sitophila]